MPSSYPKHFDDTASKLTMDTETEESSYESEEQNKSCCTPCVIGCIAGGVILVIVVILIFCLSGGGDPDLIGACQKVVDACDPKEGEGDAAKCTAEAQNALKAVMTTKLDADVKDDGSITIVKKKDVSKETHTMLETCVKILRVQPGTKKQADDAKLLETVKDNAEVFLKNTRATHIKLAEKSMKELAAAVPGMPDPSEVVDKLIADTLAAIKEMKSYTGLAQVPRFNLSEALDNFLKAFPVK